MFDEKIESDQETTFRTGGYTIDTLRSGHL